MLIGHGDDIYNQKQEIVSNFSSNVYNAHNSSALDDYLRLHINSIHTYPEPDAHSVAKLLADKNNIATDCVCVTNGATEAIYLIAQAFKNCKTAVIVPTFSEYEDACRIHGHDLYFYERLENIDSAMQLVWLCNPNNPTGYVYPIDSLQKNIDKHPTTYFVFDQSYQYFTNQHVFGMEAALQFKNVILLHSMTKRYVVPGLRLGYITAHAETLGLIAKYRMPWSVNQLAIEAARFLLSNTTESIHISDYLIETKRLQNELIQIDGLTVLGTETHFFLCKLENKCAAELKSYLIEHHGILIRDAANFRGLDKHYFRIATQSTGENDKLIKAIKEWI